jgi:hypothetical protein
MSMYTLPTHRSRLVYMHFIHLTPRRRLYARFCELPVCQRRVV